MGLEIIMLSEVLTKTSISFFLSYVGLRKIKGHEGKRGFQGGGRGGSINIYMLHVAKDFVQLIHATR